MVSSEQVEKMMVKKIICEGVDIGSMTLREYCQEHAQNIDKVEKTIYVSYRCGDDWCEIHYKGDGWQDVRVADAWEEIDLDDEGIEINLDDNLICI